MRGVLLFLAPRLLRALIAVWLVSTVVFVVMRLSGDPVPLLLPPDAPRREIFRLPRPLPLDPPLPPPYRPSPATPPPPAPAPPPPSPPPPPPPPPPPTRPPP